MSGVGGVETAQLGEVEEYDQAGHSPLHETPDMAANLRSTGDTPPLRYVVQGRGEGQLQWQPDDVKANREGVFKLYMRVRNFVELSVS